MSLALAYRVVVLQIDDEVVQFTETLELGERLYVVDFVIACLS
jgi:hypothetical protein